MTKEAATTNEQRIRERLLYRPRKVSQRRGLILPPNLDRRRIFCTALSEYDQEEHNMVHCGKDPQCKSVQLTMRALISVQPTVISGTMLISVSLGLMDTAEHREIGALLV